MNYTIQLFDFFHRLDENNNRPWFHEHKDEYDFLRECWIKDIDKLLALMTQWEPDLAGQTAKNCVYRIYRDTRFSPDKTPYKRFFSAAFSPWGRKTNRACYYLQMGVTDPDRHLNSGLYGGMWCPDSDMLRKVRTAIVDNDEEFSEIIENKEFKSIFPDFDLGDKLKTVPRGFDKNSKFAEILKMKNIGKYCPAGEAFFTREDWVEETARRFSLLKPFIDFINYSIDEEI